MDSVARKRTALMGRLAGIRSRVSAMNSTTARIDDLDAEMECLSDWWLDYRKLHDGILDLCKDDDLLDDIIKSGIEADQEHNSVKAMITQFQRVIRNRDNPVGNTTSVLALDHNASPVGLPELNLPKGMLPTFSGDYGEWTLE